MSEQMSELQKLHDACVSARARYSGLDGSRFEVNAFLQKLNEARAEWQNAESAFRAALSHSTRPAGTEAETIERCAKVAESYDAWSYVRVGSGGQFEPASPYDRGQAEAAKNIATAIRALTPQTTGEKP